MKIKKNLVKRSIMDEVILVPVENTSLAVKGLITLNETAEFLWDKLPDAEDAAYLAALLCGEYEVEPADALRDTEEFLAELTKLGII